MGIMAQRHWPINFIRCLKSLWASWPDRSNSWQEVTQEAFGRAEKWFRPPCGWNSGSSQWRRILSTSGYWAIFSNSASAEVNRILLLAWMKIRSCIKRMSTVVSQTLSELYLLIMPRKVVLRVSHLTFSSHSSCRYHWWNFFWLLLQPHNCLSCVFFPFAT